MQTTLYVHIVRKHLRMARARQDTILTELNEHCSHMPDQSAVENQLGDPVQLARAYNRTHLGWLSTTIRMYGTPIFFAMIFYLSNFVIMYLMRYASFAMIERTSILMAALSMIAWIILYSLLFKTAALMRKPRWHYMMILILIGLTVALPEMYQGFAPAPSHEMAVVIAALFRSGVITLTAILVGVATGAIKKIKYRVS